MNERILDSDSEQQTHDIGRRLGAALRTGDVVAMIGQLGAGKTRLVKGVAEGGVPDPRSVNSPTFVIVNEYDSKPMPLALHIYHIDAYRLRGGGDLEAIGFDEMAQRGAVLIEWADRIADILPADALTLEITVTAATSRRIRAAATGPQSERLLAALAQT